MPRIRYLKPEFFKDEDLAKLPPLYRIAFEGLWCYADKEGRLKDRPLQLKIEILPYDEVSFEEILKCLAAKKPVNNNTSFITRYEVNSEKYIQINKFKEHQKPHHTEKDSDIPGFVTVRQRNINRLGTPSKGMEKGMEKGSIMSTFETFWESYPKKEDKTYAFKCYERCIKNGITLEQILNHLEIYNKKLTIEQTEKTYIKLPSTFLNKTDFKEIAIETKKEPKTTVQDKIERAMETQNGH